MLAVRCVTRPSWSREHRPTGWGTVPCPQRQLRVCRHRTRRMRPHSVGVLAALRDEPCPAGVHHLRAAEGVLQWKMFRHIGTDTHPEGFRCPVWLGPYALPEIRRHRSLPPRVREQAGLSPADAIPQIRMEGLLGRRARMCGCQGAPREAATYRG